MSRGSSGDYSSPSAQDGRVHNAGGAGAGWLPGASSAAGAHFPKKQSIMSSRDSPIWRLLTDRLIHFGC